MGEAPTQVITAPMSEYLRLLVGIEALLASGFQRLRDKGKLDVDQLVHAAEVVIAGLRSESSIKTIDFVFSQLDPVVVDAFRGEMRYCNANNPRLANTGTFPRSGQSFDFDNDANTDTSEQQEVDAANDAKTAKDSLENLLGDGWIVKKIKDYFKVLNEILSIVFRGGA